MRKERFLVTGGAGFIGSHIVEALIKKGNFVRVLDNFSSGKKENLTFIAHYAIHNTQYELIKGDIRNYDTCYKASKGIDYVLHQAALRSVPKSLEIPHEFNDVNITGTLNMLEASLKNKVKRLVCASSSSVYGDINIFPEKEDFLPRLISPYALTKLTDEHYCKIFSLHYGLSTACLRYFNVFGPRQSLDDEYAVVIPKFINCLLKDEPCPIYGTGRQSRDFTYVSNVVEANLLAARRCKPMGEVFNVACGKDYSILSLVKTLNRLTDKNIKPLFLPIRKGDVYKTLADISKSKKVLGFKPRVDFVQGLRLTLEWFEKNA